MSPFKVLHSIGQSQFQLSTFLCIWMGHMPSEDRLEGKLPSQRPERWDGAAYVLPQEGQGSTSGALLPPLQSRKRRMSAGLRRGRVNPPWSLQRPHPGSNLGPHSSFVQGTGSTAAFYFSALGPRVRAILALVSCFKQG